MDSSVLKSVSDTPDLDFKWLKEAAGNDDVVFSEYISRRLTGEPVAKIIGQKGFWSLDLEVSKDTLDPRPDSETIIEAVLKHFPDKKANLRILDLGTGSGCLLLALLTEYQNATGIGIDVSISALKVAQKNVDKYAPNRAKLLCRSWVDSNWWADLGGFDVVVSNPPYIPTADIAFLDKDVKDFDPIQALDGGADGLDDYRRLSGKIEQVLKQNGLIFFEIGQGQYMDVTAIMEKKGFKLAGFYHDLGQIIRVLVFKR